MRFNRKEKADSMRHLVLILGDQLSFSNPALAQFDPAQDRVLMIEAPGEATAVWSHKARITLFLSAMRHFAQELNEKSWPLDYVKLEHSAGADFTDRLAEAIVRNQPQAIKLAEPGEWRMHGNIEAVCAAAAVPLMLIDDTHFLCSRQEFATWAGAKKELRMEFFYRVMRKKWGVLMDGAEPAGGSWNFDADNRSAYPKRGKQAGPGQIPAPAGFAPDALTLEVMELVQSTFAEHPGALDDFVWPVTREQALHALSVFVATRLPQFGLYQDAMWTETPFGWHALLSTSLNLHLLDPREVIAAVETAYRAGQVPLPSAEGFIRQILGWREFIRGMYWLDMPGMKEANHYQHTRALPRWFWTGDTQMQCLRDSLSQTLRYGYAHHIQRLMVMGNFALLAELSPQQVADWYLAIYVDAVEWVELPNTAGMALHACGSRFTSKPYISSGAYINRQSNYCSGCRYDPTLRTGDQACPFTTLYWHFIDRHAANLSSNPRTALMAKNLDKLSQEERSGVRERAAEMLAHLDTL
jgi:deoxyribodipyrimidine photolyase-related protein